MANCGSSNAEQFSNFLERKVDDHNFRSGLKITTPFKLGDCKYDLEKDNVKKYSSKKGPTTALNLFMTVLSFFTNYEAALTKKACNHIDYCNNNPHYDKIPV